MPLATSPQCKRTVAQPQQMVNFWRSLDHPNFISERTDTRESTLTPNRGGRITDNPYIKSGSYLCYEYRDLGNSDFSPLAVVPNGKLMGGTAVPSGHPPTIVHRDILLDSSCSCQHYP